MNKGLTILFGMALLSGGLCTIHAQEEFPLAPRVADAYIQKYGDWYYLTGTPCPGDWDMQWVGVWKSRDLVNWSGPVLAFEGEVRDRPMWASEMHRKGDDYYIITTCNTWNPGNTFMVQKAPSPDGPFTFHSFLPKKGLDPSIFIDTDGKSYLLDSEWIAPLDDDWTRITNEFIGHRDNKEGPFMVKSDNDYLRFYARIDPTYYMEMESLKGNSPYSVDYVEQGEVLTGPWLPGHGCITPSPDGSELWYAAHANTDGSWETRALAIDPMRFESGRPVPTSRNDMAKPAPSLSRKVNLAHGKVANSTAFLAGHEPHKAIDGNRATWWEAVVNPVDSVAPYLEIDLMGEFLIDGIAARTPDKKKSDAEVVVSCDRINWMAPSSDRAARYVRFLPKSDCRIADVEISRVPYHIPSRGKEIASFASGDQMKFTVPATGTYDIEYVVESRDLNSEWALYDNSTLVARSNVAHTGPAGNNTRIISFDVPLSSDREHNLKIVPVAGDYTIEKITIYSQN